MPRTPAEHLRQEDPIEAKVFQPLHKLRKDTIEKIVRDKAHRDHLFEIGAIPESDTGRLRKWVEGIFENYLEQSDPKTACRMDTPEYRELVKVLVMANLLMLSTRSDYLTARGGESLERRVGTNPFAEIEEALVTEYPPKGNSTPVNLTKGSGTNLNVCQRNQQEEGRYKHFGMGDVLYHEVEDLLLRFIRHGHADDPSTRQFIHVLAVALQRRLHSEWFEDVRTEESVAPEWRQKVPFCDLNRIYQLLADPEELLSEVDRKTRYTDSMIYMDDSLRRLPISVQIKLLEYRGVHAAEAQKRHLEISLVELESSIKPVRKLCKRAQSALKDNEDSTLDRLNEEYRLLCAPASECDLEPGALANAIKTELGNRVSHLEELRLQISGECPEVQEAQRVHRQLCQSIGTMVGIRSHITSRVENNQFKTEDKAPEDFITRAQAFVTISGEPTVQELLEKLDEAIEVRKAAGKESRMALDKLKEEKNAASPHTQLDGPICEGESLHTDQVLRSVFTDEFCNGVRSAEFFDDPKYHRADGFSNILDLNGCPVTHLENFIPGDFMEIPKMFPEPFALFIDAVRSDSHLLNDEEFLKSLWDTCELLYRGGLHVTDGILASWLGAIRLPTEMNKTRFDCRVVMDAHTHMPRSLASHRKHPTKTSLFKDERMVNACFPVDDGSVYLRTIYEVLNLRPDLAIIYRTRRKFAEAVKGNEEAFAEIQGSLITDVHKLLVQESARQSIDDTLLSEGVHRLDIGVLIDHVQNSTRRTAKRRAGKKRKAEQEAYGNPENLTEHGVDNLMGLNVEEIRKKIMEMCEADESNPFVVKFYREAIFQWVYAILCEMWYGSESASDTPTALLPELLHEKKKKLQEYEKRIRDGLLSDARNVSCSINPVIGSTTVEAVCKTLEKELHEVVRKHAPEGETVLAGTLERLSPSLIHAFPHIVRRPSVLDGHFEADPKSLADNEYFFGAEAEKRFEKTCEEVRRQSLDARNCIGGAPFNTLTFTDCATNVLLRRKAQVILGDCHETCLTDHKIDLREKREGGRPGKSQIAHLSSVLRKLRPVLNKTGGIILGGGSWWDTYVAAGEDFKKNIGTLILKAIRTFRSSPKYYPPVCFGGICFSNQFMGDLIGEPLEISTKRGCLEFGPTKIHAFSDDPVAREIFDTENGGNDLSLVMTHSGHLRGREFHRHGTGLMVPLANSELTKNPCAWKAEDGLVVGLQFHPEVAIGNQGAQWKHIMTDDVRMVMDQLDGQDPMLRKMFGSSTLDIQRNWELGQKHIIGDAGKHILANLMLYLIARLNKELGIYS